VVVAASHIHLLGTGHMWADNRQKSSRPGCLLCPDPQRRKVPPKGKGEQAAPWQSMSPVCETGSPELRAGRGAVISLT